MTRFSDEEKSIIGMYNTADRVGLIVKIKEAIPYIEDADLKDTAADIISKLVVMTDKEFADLEVRLWQNFILRQQSQTAMNTGIRRIITGIF